MHRPSDGGGLNSSAQFCHRRLFQSEQPMPWFHFHLRGPKKLERDSSGLEFPSLEAAYPEARHTGPEIDAERVRMTVNAARQALQISDDSDALLIEVPFSEIPGRAHRPVPPFGAAQAAAAVQLARSAGLINALREEHAVTRAKEVGR